MNKTFKYNKKRWYVELFFYVLSIPKPINRSPKLAKKEIKLTIKSISKVNAKNFYDFGEKEIIKSRSKLENTLNN